MAKHDVRIDAKVSGPTWDAIRKRVLAVHRGLIDVDASAASELTTIYVKYKVTDQPLGDVFGVMWVRFSKQVVLGLATPQKINDERVIDAPSGMAYPRLKTYVRIDEKEAVPADLGAWIQSAFAHVKSLSEQA